MPYTKIKRYFALCHRFFQNYEIIKCELLILSMY